MSIRSWVFGDDEGEKDDRKEDDLVQEDGKEEAQKMTPLDPEEIRRRRLKNAQLMSSSSPSPPPKPSAEASTPKRPKVAGGGHNSSIDKNEKNKAQALSVKSVDSGESSNTPTKVRMDRYTRTLNLALEYIFQITIRRDNVKTNIKYMENDDEGEFLNTTNLDLYLPMRLMEIVQDDSTEHELSAVSYLLKCYKRVIEKEGLSTANEPIVKDYAMCRIQIVRFLVSALTDEDLGGQNSQSNFMRALGIETGQAGGVNLLGLLKELADEMCTMQVFDEVASNFFMMCYQGLHNPSPPPATAPLALRHQNQRSIFDDISEPLQALSLLIKSDKRFARAATASNCFLANEAVLKTASPNRGMMFGPRSLETDGVGGCHIEHNTLLGRIIRIGASSQDPKVFELFKDAWKSPPNVIEGNVAKIRRIMTSVQSQTCDIILSLLKAGPQAKEITMKWIFQAVMFNAEAEKDRPSPLVSSSQAFLFNLGGVLLRLVYPIISDPKKLAKVDWRFLQWIPSKEVSCDSDHLLFPSSSTKLMTFENGDSKQFDSTIEFTFITQSFFCAIRILHLGVVQDCIRYPNILRAISRYSAGFETGDVNALHHLSLKFTLDASLVCSDLINDAVELVPSFAKSLLDQFVGLRKASGKVDKSSWTVPKGLEDSADIKLLSSIPEHLIDDVLEILLFVAKSNPPVLSATKTSLVSVLDLILYLLRRPWGVSSPHLRAKLGQTIYFVFIPPSSRGGDQNRFQIEHYRTTSAGNAVERHEGSHHQLLDSHEGCQAYLAPALLLLYGDVESTGFYEILSHRRCIMVVLKHLWTLPSHRPAFRAISLDKKYFISFANGILNETNSLVGSVIEKLAEIRVTQLQMQDASQWSSLSEEEKKEQLEKHENNENEVRAKSELCMETIHMLNYLTSEDDESLRLPFLADEILPRFSSMLLNVVRLLVGAKGLEIKVDNMESYNFKPKCLLQEVCVILTHFCPYESFVTALSSDGFIADSEGNILLRKALQTVQKLRLLNSAEVGKLTELVTKVVAARANYKDIDSLIDSAPEEYLDPLMATIMRDPVLLPTSDTIVDRATITTQLLQNSIDPFNRKPLTIDDVIPQDELKEEIAAWLLSHGV